MLMLNPTPRSPRLPRLVLTGLLLPLAIIGALVLSASATVDLFTSQGVDESIVWAAVLMVEVTVLAGTLLWLLVERRSLRRDARLVTLGATAVTLVAGLVAYGPVGAVAGVFAVAVTHLASRAWREPWNDEPVARPARAATVAELVQARPAPARQDTPPPVQCPVPAAPEPTAAVPEWWPHTPEMFEQAVRDAKAGTGRPTLIKRYEIKDHQARKVLAEVTS